MIGRLALFHQLDAPQNEVNFRLRERMKVRASDALGGGVPRQRCWPSVFVGALSAANQDSARAAVSTRHHRLLEPDSGVERGARAPTPRPAAHSAAHRERRRTTTGTERCWCAGLIADACAAVARFIGRARALAYAAAQSRAQVWRCGVGEHRCCCCCYCS